MSSRLLNILILFTLFFLFGFLYGEFKTCPRSEYSWDYGCKVGRNE